MIRRCSAILSAEMKSINRTQKYVERNGIIFKIDMNFILTADKNFKRIHAETMFKEIKQQSRGEKKNANLWSLNLISYKTNGRMTNNKHILLQFITNSINWFQLDERTFNLISDRILPFYHHSSYEKGNNEYYLGWYRDTRCVVLIISRNDWNEVIWIYLLVKCWKEYIFIVFTHFFTFFLKFSFVEKFLRFFSFFCCFIFFWISYFSLHFFLSSKFR